MPLTHARDRPRETCAAPQPGPLDVEAQPLYLPPGSGVDPLEGALDHGLCGPGERRRGSPVARSSARGITSRIVPAGLSSEHVETGAEWRG